MKKTLTTATLIALMSTGSAMAQDDHVFTFTAEPAPRAECLNALEQGKVLSSLYPNVAESYSRIYWNKTIYHIFVGLIMGEPGKVACVKAELAE